MSRPHGRCKERDEIGGGADEQDKHFFKVMVGDFHDRVTIPHQFVQHFRGEITRTIKLESRNGCTFDVQVTKDLDKLVLQSGWEMFISAHEIKVGDFLVFKYDGNSRFKVLIFDPSGCEKLSSSLSKKNAPRDGQGWEEPVETSSRCHDLSMRSLQSERRPRTQWGSSSQGNKIINISSSSAQSESSGDVLSSEDDRESPFVPSPILRNGASVTEIQKKKMQEKVHAIRSKIPIYGSVITKCNVLGSPCTFLDLTSKYADAYLPCEDQTLMLQRHDKSWKVRLRINKNSTKRLLQGWKKFAHDNNLKIGDLCLFELLKKKNCTMNVHIIRKR